MIKFFLVILLFVPAFAFAESKLSQGTEAASPSEAINCPDGTEQVGQAPPAGHEVKCLDENGKQQGVYKRWYPNGQLMQLGSYKDGLQHGEQQSWYPNGQMMTRGTSIMGKRYEQWEYWDMQGKPRELSIETKKIKIPADELQRNAADVSKSDSEKTGRSAEQGKAGEESSPPLIYRR